MIRNCWTWGESI